MNKKIDWIKCEKVFSLLIIFAIIMIVFVKDSTICITWDESLTYSAYVRPIADSHGNIFTIWNIISQSTGNNHLLNTALIIIAEFFFGSIYNEMVVRLPSLVACIIYMLFLWYLYQNKKINIAGFGLFALNYYVIDFFSLARGYSLAVTTIFGALFLLKKWHDDGHFKYLSWCCILLGIATLANTVCLIITLSIGCYVFLILLQRHEFFPLIKKHFIFLFLYAFYNVVMTFYHFLITNNDPYLFYTSELFPLKVIKDFLEMYWPTQTVILTIGAWIYFILLFVTNYYCFKNRKGIYCPILLIYFMISIILAILSGKGVPSDRALLPTFALFVYAMLEMYELCIKSYIAKVKYGMVTLKYVIVIVLLVCFISRINFTSSIDWEISKNFKSIAYSTFGEQEKLSPERLGTGGSNYDGIKFYREQILYLYGYDIF